MNKDKRNNIKLLGTLNNSDESGIIANANQVYDANEDKSTQDVSKEHKERIETLETKESSMQTTLENITKTGEASAASNVTYNHNETKLVATNMQQAIDEVYTRGYISRDLIKNTLEQSISDNKATVDTSIQDVYKKSNYNDGDNIIDFNTIHIIEEDPLWSIALLDKEDKIIFGYKRGTDEPYWGIGIPKVVKDYINPQIEGNTNIDGLQKVLNFLKGFKSSDNLKSLLNAQNESVNKIFNAQNESVNKIFNAQNESVNKIFNASNPHDDEGNIIPTSEVTSFEDNNEYLKLTLDKNEKMLEAILKNGFKKIFVGLDIASNCFYNEWDNDYILLILDKNEKILIGLTKDLQWYNPTGAVSDEIIRVINAEINKTLGTQITFPKTYSYDDFSKVTSTTILEKQDEQIKIVPSKSNAAIILSNNTILKKGDFVFIRTKVKAAKDTQLSLGYYSKSEDQVNELYNLEENVEREIYMRGKVCSKDGTLNIYIQSINAEIILSEFIVCINHYNAYNDNETKETLKYFSPNKHTYVVDVNGNGDFFSIRNAVDFLKSSFDVENIPYTIYIHNGYYNKEAVNTDGHYPYAFINKGSDKISLIGESREHTVLECILTDVLQGKFIEVGSSPCIIANMTIRVLRGDTYTKDVDKHYNPYCLHIDLGSDREEKYTTELYNLCLYDEIHAPIGCGLSRNQTISIHQCKLIGNSSITKNDVIYIHAYARGIADYDSTMAVDIEDNIAIAMTGGKALNLGDVKESTYKTISCTIIGNKLYSSDKNNITNVKASTHNLQPFCMGNNIDTLNI